MCYRDKYNYGARPITSTNISGGGAGIAPTIRLNRAGCSTALILVTIALAMYIERATCCFAQTAVAPNVLYVALNGDDSNPGTLDKPFATPLRARDAVRQLIANGLKEDVQVFLRGGVYYLSEPLIFDHRDSGAKLRSVTYSGYPGEHVTICGGRRITGWKQTESSAWSVIIPEAVAGEWYFRELYVNGKRAIRARTPNADAKDPYYQLEGSKLTNDLDSWEIKMKPGQVANWKNLKDVEIVVLKTYEIIRKKLIDVKVATGRFLLKPPNFIACSPDFYKIEGYKCFLENAMAFLDQPGEWYLDRATGELRYWPQVGEAISSVECIAPVLSRLMIVQGTEHQLINNLHFTNLAFSHAAWSLPEVGYVGNQAAFYHEIGPAEQRRYFERMSASVSFEYTDNCSVEDCEIAHTGAHGVELRRGCRANVLQGNHIFDVGANGVLIGEPRGGSNATTLVCNNRVVNNFIHDCGVSVFGAVGIWCGMASQTLIAHNLVHNMPYTGISVGWVWGTGESECKNNLILSNHVHHVMKMMSDGGGIYTLGKQPGTIIKGNVVHDLSQPSAASQKVGTFGIYFDAGSSALLAENNVIYNIASKPWVFGWGTDSITLRNNIAGRQAVFTKGVVGYGMVFNDNDYLDTPHEPNLEPTNLTVEAWVNFIEFPTGGDPTVWIVSKNANEFTAGNYALAVSHRNVGAYLNNGGGREGCYSSWSINNPIQTNAWNHLAMTYDGHDLKVYCNGALSGSTTVNPPDSGCRGTPTSDVGGSQPSTLSRPRSTGSGLLRIGKRADDYNPAFHGLMDEVRIYNRALSAEEIATRFTQPFTLDPQLQRSVVAAWPFDDMKEKMDRVIAEAGPQEPYRSRFKADQESWDEGLEPATMNKAQPRAGAPAPHTAIR